MRNFTGIICLFYVIILAPFISFSTEIDSPELEVEINSDKKIYNSGETVRLFINIKNNADRTIIINKDWYSPNNGSLVITDSEGKMVPPLILWDMGPPTKDSFVDLDKNTIYHELFDIDNDYFDLTIPGTYKIQIKYENLYKEYFNGEFKYKKIGNIDAWVGSILSNVIEISIQ